MRYELRTYCSKYRSTSNLNIMSKIEESGQVGRAVLDRAILCPTNDLFTPTVLDLSALFVLSDFYFGFGLGKHHFHGDQGLSEGNQFLQVGGSFK
jgi:hypothetical protein